MAVSASCWVFYFYKKIKNIEKGVDNAIVNAESTNNHFILIKMLRKIHKKNVNLLNEKTYDIWNSILEVLYSNNTTNQDHRIE